MNRGNVLVVSVDGLRASALGAYGNTTFATPALDSFAAESFLLDNCLAPAVELRDVYRALWHGVHPLRPSKANATALSLPHFFSQSGYRTTLITDDVHLRSFEATRLFDQCVDLATAGGSNSNFTRTRDIEQTGMAHLFTATWELIESEGPATVEPADSHTAHSPRLIWVHSRGMYGPWDAPIDLQQTLLDEGDPPPLELSAPPDLMLTAADDPDAAFRHACAYAAQVMVFDDCWRGLIESVAARAPGEPWLVVLVGSRGFPLGEHRRIGGVDDRLYVEQLHVPLLLRLPDGLGQLARSAALVSHVDLLPTLAAWIDGTATFESLHVDGMNILPVMSNSNAPWRDAVHSASTSSVTIRTATWCLRQAYAASAIDQQPMDNPLANELYVRPDDRWEANDITKLCPDVVDLLADAAAQACQQLKQNLPLAVS